MAKEAREAVRKTEAEEMGRMAMVLAMGLATGEDGD